MTPITPNETTEQKIKNDLYQYLRSQGKLDERLPECPDIEEKWPDLLQAYTPDGVREYAKYPNVSLGWMMYTGMAVAHFWDKDWETYGIIDNLYVYIRDKRGFDYMDEYVREELLGLSGKDYDDMEKLVGECAARTNSLIRHLPIEPGTKAAYFAYVDALHQMYLMGAAVCLKQMGYKMSEM